MLGGLESRQVSVAPREGCEMGWDVVTHQVTYLIIIIIKRLFRIEYHARPYLPQSGDQDSTLKRAWCGTAGGCKQLYPSPPLNISIIASLGISMKQ